MIVMELLLHGDEHYGSTVWVEWQWNTQLGFLYNQSWIIMATETLNGSSAVIPLRTIVALLTTIDLVTCLCSHLGLWQAKYCRTYFLNLLTYLIAFTLYPSNPIPADFPRSLILPPWVVTHKKTIIRIRSYWIDRKVLCEGVHHIRPLSWQWLDLIQLAQNPLLNANID